MERRLRVGSVKYFLEKKSTSSEVKDVTEYIATAIHSCFQLNKLLRYCLKNWIVIHIKVCKDRDGTKVLVRYFDQTKTETLKLKSQI